MVARGSGAEGISREISTHFFGFFFSPRERGFWKPPFYLFVSLSLSLSPSLSLSSRFKVFRLTRSFVRSLSLFASLFYDDDDDDDDDS